MNVAELEKNDFITIVNTSKINNIDLFIEQYGFERTHKDKEVFSSHGSSRYNLFFITKGSLVFTKNGVDAHLKKNALFFFDPTENVSYKTNAKNPAQYYFVSFTGREATAILKSTGFDMAKSYMYAPKTVINQLRECFFNNFNISEELKKLTDFDFMINFYSIAKLISRAAAYNQENPEDYKQMGYIENGLHYFSKHYTESDFSIAEVANHLHIHKNYFSNLFSQELGVPFSEYLAQKRTLLAVSLIRQGFNSVNKIAEAVGIPDPSYFSKVFKKHNMISPAEEIKKYKETQKKSPENNM